jgi:hypothetical protein
MAFFRDIKGNHWPASRIRMVGREQEGEGRFGKTAIRHVRLGNEDECFISDTEWTNLQRIVSTHIPAAPGTVVVDVAGEDEPSVFREPVIAWAITEEEGAIPLTINGYNDERDQSVAVLFPSGEVTRYNELWESLDKFIEAEKPVKNG